MPNQILKIVQGREQALGSECLLLFFNIYSSMADKQLKRG